MQNEIFSRARQLLGDKTIAVLSEAKILIVGTGGVGSWCAETLVRTSAINVTLVDCDIVAPSNINRQAMAKPSTIGEPKVFALKKHLLEISPNAKIEAYNLKYEVGSAGHPPFVFSNYDYVIDAIDSVDSKVSLINSALSSENTTLFSSMGAALRTDPSRVKSSDFKKVTGDGLARAIRGRFKKNQSWPSRSFTAVWSDETPVVQGVEALARGSLMQVTAAFGLKLAQLVISSAQQKGAQHKA